MRMVVRPVVRIGLIAFGLWFRLRNRKSFPEAYFKAIRGIDVRVPELYLYSEDDPLCDAKKLDGLVEAREEQGAGVESLCWQESRHVGHMLVHRSDYLEMLDAFVKRCGGRVSKAPAVKEAPV